MSVSVGVYQSADMSLKTPPPKSRTGKSKKKGAKGIATNNQMTGDESHGLLENFDLELESKERQFTSHLHTLLAAFRLRQITEIARIPPKIQVMTVEELEKYWGGNWAGTLRSITDNRQRQDEVGEGEKEKALREGVKGKRKRGGAAQDSSPERTNKNARKAATPLKGRAGVTIASSASKRKLIKKPVPFVSANPSSNGPSSLPQNHVFNPILPPTPLRKMNPSDVLLSTNGSPVVNPLSKSMRERQVESGPSRPTAPQQHIMNPIDNNDDDDDDGTEGSDSESEHISDDEEDLPDETAYAAHILSQSQSQPARSAPSRSNRAKRQPSLLWVKSDKHADGPEEEDVLKPNEVFLDLPNGEKIKFDPLALNRVEMNEDMAKMGLTAQQREEVGRLVQAEVVKALQSRIQSWC